MKTKKLAFILLLSLFVSIASFSSSTFSSIESHSVPNRLMTTSQLDDPIEITTNAELAEYSSSGVGTRSDPYIIEGISINPINGLTITGTTAFFIVRDSEFIDYRISRGGNNVVTFNQVEHGTLENCYVLGGETAITIINSIDCSIINCETYDAYTGIFISASDNCTIVDTNSFGNSIGVMLVYSNFCNIINNSIYSNNERGIHVEVFCENTTIAGNDIGWNPGLNIIDHGINTVFADDVTFGNAWSDFNASEDYDIPGTGSSTDIFARLLTDMVMPTVFGLSDFIVDVEDVGETMTWSANDIFHHQYQISIDGTLTEDRIWDGRDITFDLDDLGVGTYEIVLSVIDGAGNNRTDEVTVSVISFILGGMGTELVMLASGVTLVCFVVIMLVVKRFP